MSEPLHFLIFGNGWVSGHVQAALKFAGHSYVVSSARIENREAVLRQGDSQSFELADVKPSHVVNTAGVRGEPNVDWVETHREETIRSNIIGAANVADCCFLNGIHVTHFGSGCIYNYDESHPHGGPGYTEEDEPNFTASFYSYSKVLSEKILKEYPNVLVLRIRNPLSGDSHQKNMATRLTKFEKIASYPNSTCVLPSLLPGAIILAEHKETGVYNFTNPGVVTHNDIMKKLRKHVFPSLTWSTISQDELNQSFQAPRCNLEFDVSKLQNKLRQYGHEVPEIGEALDSAFLQLKQTMSNS